MRRIIISLLALMAATAIAAGQLPPKVSLLVAEPGEEIYELEGHAGLRIIDEDGDYTINWGLFDFDAPGFVYRFVKGETDYTTGAWPTPYFLDTYRRHGRQVEEIALDLTPSQAKRVKALITENLRPENRVYRYNYVKDNCATRPLGIIERAVGDTLAMASPPEWSGKAVTFRDIMRYYHRDYPWYQFGIDLALGSGIDYPLTPRELAFAPVLLPALMATATAAGKPIAPQPPTTLVNSELDHFTPPTSWYLTPMAAGVVLLAITILVSVRDMRRRGVSRWFDCVLFSTLGIMGCVIAFLVFLSSHEATSPNWLIVWLNPLCFIGGLLIWLKSCQKVVLCYHFVNFAAIFTLSLAWPLLGQAGNIAFIPLIAADAIRSASYIYVNRCAIKKTA